MNKLKHDAPDTSNYCTV